MIAVAERLQRMARMAFADPLTGVGNRRAMDDALAEPAATRRTRRDRRHGRRRRSEG
ncbi:hypothetical protein GCM10025868_39300 [Angustibacter aerolatus]|uniref:Uncharacterized protein n=1 Tax=Angustibacter aerolatus TaxID=1162965 RepID=A0ABQ6JK90_9ACTN|nr:hypothetical protein [Angustibacter aerolatus]GMA88680.1 hypothetical protein GCM10025868_39300 [Angustibacter aerolatus]